MSEGFRTIDILKHRGSARKCAHFTFLHLQCASLMKVFTIYRKRMFDILETVVNERFDRPDEHKGRRDYAQFVVKNCPDYRQVVPAHLLSLMFAGHVNTVRPV